MIDLGINLFQEIAALGGGGGFNITNSLRFNDDDSAYLSRTPSVAGNRKTWTWSGWVKRGNLGSRQFLFTCADVNAQNSLYFEFSNNDEINIADYNTNWVWQKTTTGVFRDVSGWYHIVLRYDTTESTASDRIKLYVNGAQVTAFGTNTDPSLNYDGFINTTTNPHRIGSINAVSLEFDGYMAEVNFIDGQALTADDFGEINEDTGEWSPKRYSGTYGTNGFYLPFNGNANDDSGNGNNWTENNLASTDYMIDTPTNNLSVFNPLANGGGTLSEGNLKLTGASAAWGTRLSTIAVSSGKWYAEITPTSGSATQGIIFGISNYITAPSSFIGSASTSYGYYGFDGGLYSSGVKTTAWGATVADNDIVGIALDMDAGTLKLYKNNVQQGTTITGLSGLFYIGVSCYGTATANINFGQDSSFAGIKTRQGNTDANGIGDFYYTPPTGYLALCTDNLPAPAIEQPETQFNVVLDTGANIKATAEALYDSSLIWIKDRVNSNNHQLIDTVRGTGVLQSNTTAAETTYSAPSGNSVAWVWKAGGTAVSNTDGTITSQVSANVDAGFSIVGYTGDGGTGDATVGHGLTKAPELIIHKNRDSAANWPVTYTIVDGTNDYLYLNLTNSYGNATQPSPTSSVFYIQSSAGQRNNTENYIQYCFHSVEGFSKFGSYTGNGSADGPFIYTGFRPAFVMVKRTDSTANWNIWDKERSDYNPANDLLQPDSSAAEYVNLTAWDIDLVSNGFKVRGTNQQVNASGGTYIYMAFAEHPFKEALAR